MLACAGALLIIIGVAPAKANNPVVTAISDYWFEFTQPSVFTARTYSISGSPSDPQLWLFDNEGRELVTNDDHYGLQSFIEYSVDPGWYRLRAGTCCYEPEIWRPWTVSYELSFSNSPANQSTTTTEQSTTTVATTTTSTTMEPTTTSTTTTTTEVPWTTTSSTSPPNEPTTTFSTELSTTTSALISTTTTMLLPELSTSLPQTTLPPSITSSSSSISPPSLTTTTIRTFPATTTSQAASTIPPTTVTETSAATTSTIAPEALPQNVTESIFALSASSTDSQIDEAVQQIAENIESLSAEQLDEIAATLSNASAKVKAKFESQVNIFGGGLDKYIPAGSTIPVGQRRTLVVIGAVLTAMPVLSARRR